MSLKIYNTLTRRKEDFIPLHHGRVHMYVCGPTVYDYPHIGHAKSYVGFDVVVRYLRFLGYRVLYVQNITDVGHLLDSGEDRIQRGAEREKLQPMELVEKYTRAYFSAMDALNVLRPDISPRASGHVPEQIELVQRLLEKGYAYEVNGSVYFDVSKWPEYGKLSGRRVEDQMAGARLEINEKKRHPADFALWKKAEPEHIMQWNSPWGRGFPGWHVECSAMAMKYLGETIDIHGGGLENQFPHHDCEIAQSEAATGKPFVRYWLHNNMVLVNGVKMSKSLGNFTTVAQALETYSGDEIRFFILQTHYRSPVDFSDDALQAAAQGLNRLQSLLLQLDYRLQSAASAPPHPQWQRMNEHYRALFFAAMDDDFNTPAAIAHLFDFARDVNKALSSSDQALGKEDLRMVRESFGQLFEQILGLRLSQQKEIAAAPFLDLLLELRSELRRKKEWPLADLIRDRLKQLGIEVEDDKDKSRWKVVKYSLK